MLWLATITVRDEKDSKSVNSIHLNAPDIIIEEAEDPAEFVAALVSQLDDFIDGQIISINLSRSLTLPAGLKAAPVPGSDVEEGLSVTWKTDINTTVQTRFPTWSEDLLTLTGDVIDSVPLADFWLMFTSPAELAGNWSVHPSDSQSQIIRRRERARERFRPR